MDDLREMFGGMAPDEADRTVDALAGMLAALPTDDADPVDRATRAGVEGFVMGYRTNHT
ncbi:hypothetical protein J2X28_002310 [Kocuria rhizophila]|uniref:hypothetical protein n=1 Tax=Kocuria rhizophila TaxID=72000 RepID=UPI002859FE25|nr:hypothetical protein [Kocuria rhizophila]MDR7375305.1 hypothetical protein [Kocuria rhizophila]